MVSLNSINVNVMDYIKPARCNETEFRALWTEFEWENKVNIHIKAPSLASYLEDLMRETKMSCLTPNASLAGECRFLSANLYAQSLFGEEALANLSLEQESSSDGTPGRITGHARIRSKRQGLALCLGDQISAIHRSTAAAA
jgi:coatomer subunit beta